MSTEVINVAEIFGENGILTKVQMAKINTEEARNITDRFHFLSASLPKIKNKS